MDQPRAYAKIMTGSRTATSRGTPYRRVKVGATSYALTDFDARAYGDGLLSIEPRTPGATVLSGLDLGDGVVDDFYRVLYMPYYDSVLADFRVHDIVATNLERGFSSIKNARDGLFEDVVAIGRAQGCADIGGGFTTSNAAVTNVTYRRCTAQGFHQVTTGYVQGDGFSDEEACRAMVYEDCVATDNGDGGLDTKSSGVRVIRFTAARNKRNLRLWGSGTVTDLRSEDPTSAHIWCGGEARLGQYVIERPVFVGGSTKPHLQVDAGSSAASITVVDPVVPAGESLRVVQNGSGKDVKVEVRYSSAPQSQPQRVAVAGSWVPGDLSTLVLAPTTQG